MGRRTFEQLRAAFSLALVACQKEDLHEKKPEVHTVEHEPRPLELPAPAVKPLPHPCAGVAVADLRPGTPVDYLELRVDRPDGSTYDVVSANGRPCTKALAPQACEQMVNVMRQPRLATQDHIDDWTVGYFVYTRGNEVGTVVAHEVARFLAPIDTPAEAAIVNFYNAGVPKEFACEARFFELIANEFVATRSEEFVPCQNLETTVRVTREGGVERKRTTVAPPGCPPLPRRHPVVGRRAEGDEASAGEAPSTLGAFFDACAEMEAASVRAFRVLESDIARFRGPRSLRTRARRSAVDEARHARQMRALARRFGGVRAARGRRPVESRARSAFAVAMENAVVGCVDETWAALVATWQAAYAADAGVRDELAKIARDETRHAALAWDVAAWLESELSEDERASIRAARARAIAVIAAEARSEPPSELRITAGLPSARDASRLCEQLWSALAWRFCQRRSMSS